MEEDLPSIDTQIRCKPPGKSALYWGRIVSLNDDESIDVEFGEGIGLKSLLPEVWKGCPRRSPPTEDSDDVAALEARARAVDEKLWPAWLEPDRSSANAAMHAVHVARFPQPLPTVEEARKVGLFYSERAAAHTPMPPSAWNAISDESWTMANRQKVIGCILWNACACSKERPERVRDTWEELQAAGITDLCTLLPTGRRATEEDLVRVHSADHVREMMSLLEAPPAALLLAQLKANFAYFGPHTVECALLASGGCLEAVDAVIAGNVQAAACVVRPPGHHSCAGSAMGFCIFNNVAVAAAYAVQNHGLERVLIVDWDIHHGNGTQDIFYKDKRVMYFSVHRHDEGFFYPGTNPAVGADSGKAASVGEDEGAGFNINVAWSVTQELPVAQYPGNAEYSSAWQRVLLPIARAYNPELVLISAGFDAAKGDPEGECQITPAGYAHLTNALMDLAGGRVILVLEGGYNVPSIKYGFGACVSSLLGAHAPTSEDFGMPSAPAERCVDKTVAALSPFWSEL
mmetsp:Transcript_162119/g.299194  ORF Transcript_162119/g.299194 Transcript_162119/m.299194 type:complete len:516 (-) Transcript_162119:149-1696(-)